MSKYKVVGDKVVQYWTDVVANSEDEAYTIAKDLESHKWFQLENDDIIEPYEIELIEDNFVQDISDISDNSL
jgi:hypothetical protein